MSIIFNVKNNLEKEIEDYILIKNIKDKFIKFTSVIKKWLTKDNNIAEFIRYFLAGNFVTLIQFITLPLFQFIFKSTSLIYMDFHFVGPIGPADRIAYINDVGANVYDPYYVFNFTGGRVGDTVTRTLNGIEGEYLSRGGLAFFLAMFLTLIIAQIITFIIQKNMVFKSKGGVGKAVAWFIIATIIITIGQNILYTIYQPWVYNRFGDNIGGMIASFVQAIITFWVFYPIFKIIFNNNKS